MFPGFLTVLGLPLVAGADFTGHAQLEAIVTETLARRLFDGANPLGQTILVPVVAEPKPRTLRIVGVTKDVPFNGPRLGARPVVFMPCLTQTRPWPSSFVVTIVVRSNRTLEDLRPSVSSVVDSLGAQYVYNVRDVADDLEESVQQEQMLGTVAGTLGVLVMFVTGVALFAFSSYLSTFRAREFAIRSALGASRFRVSASLLKEIVVILCVGSIVGTAFTLMLRQALTALIAGAPSPQVRDLMSGVLLIGAIVAGATIVPTIRTLRLDLARALRVE
jgi:ABC-type antimicrobial peptide transport system permease subunit